MSLERLDKVLCHHGFGSRKDVKKLCHRQLVFLNGNIVTDSAQKVDVEKDRIEIDGEEIRLQKDIYIMMNKCMNTVCANKDGEHSTVFDLLDDSVKHKFLGGDIHCMGRLDIDTEGLLILTTDGQLTHRLLSPKTHIPKQYAVGLEKKLSSQEKQLYIKTFAEGFWIDREQNESGFQCQSSYLEFLKDDEGLPLENFQSGKVDCYLTIFEGKFHQVKRMFAQMGNRVIYLKRIKMGNLKLDSSIPLGQWKELSEEELSLLKEPPSALHSI